MQQDIDVVETLRRDLQDGADLALAMRLVADALDRRVERVRRSLRAVAVSRDGSDGEVLGGLVERLHAELETHQSSLGHHRGRLQAAVDELDEAMSTLADELDED